MPSDNYFGPDSFSYQIYDGAVFSEKIYVSIIINPVNDAPVTQDENVSIFEDNSYIGSLQVEDVDGDDLTYFITAAPAHGSVELSEEVDGDYLYVPSSNYFGPDSFSFAANDGALFSDHSKVYITVEGVNDAPMSEEGVQVNILEDQEHVDFLYGEDVDEDPVTFHIVMEPSHGIITLSDDDQGQYTYVPDLNYFGTDSFSYSVSDGDIFSDTSMVYVSVFGVNDAPVIEIIEDQSILEG